jgi:hypothetical protein
MHDWRRFHTAVHELRMHEHTTSCMQTMLKTVLNAGTLIWHQLLRTDSGAERSFGDAFYFSVVTFLTIGYGDLAPASDAGKVFFILYCIASLVLQLTIVSDLVSTTITFRPADPEDLYEMRRVSHLLHPDNSCSCLVLAQTSVAVLPRLVCSPPCTLMM